MGANVKTAGEMVFETYGSLNSIPCNALLSNTYPDRFIIVYRLCNDQQVS